MCGSGGGGVEVVVTKVFIQRKILPRETILGAFMRARAHTHARTHRHTHAPTLARTHARTHAQAPAHISILSVHNLIHSMCRNENQSVTVRFVQHRYTQEVFL